MIDHDEIRARLRARFKDLGLSATGKWLKDCGIGQTTVRNFLDGMTQSLTVDTVVKLAPALKTSEKWILFGDSQDVSGEALQEMAQNAVSEIQAGATIEQIRSVVASSMRDQLALYLTVGGAKGSSGALTAHGTTVRSPSPTSEDALEEPRTT